MPLNIIDRLGPESTIYNIVVDNLMKPFDDQSSFFFLQIMTYSILFISPESLNLNIFSFMVLNSLSVFENLGRASFKIAFIGWERGENDPKSSTFFCTGNGMLTNKLEQMQRFISQLIQCLQL